ncbi:MAG TPA: phytoene/squalene synthase family protein [Gemmatimonadales bacterium]|nr:phytoene/squalene synthase family protein [Gemmatimonadales bacterium]
MTAEFTDASTDRAFCHAALPRVSRTFAVSIRLLPPQLEYTTLVAYLLCRVADTIEDATALSPEEKRRLLEAWSRGLDDGGPEPDPVRSVFSRPATDEERLAWGSDRVLREFRGFSPAVRAAIRPWVQEMCSGMAEYAGRRTLGDAWLTEIGTLGDLDRYTYYVAGTVGHLLTDLFGLHAAAVRPSRLARLRALATSFGRGLQLTNIIKDVADDRRRGWSFVPRQLCDVCGVRPEDLQDGRHREGARQVMLALITKAKGHLTDALAYTTTIPRREYGIRMFCLSALYFAVRTLRLAEGEPRLLDPGHRVKISRAAVHRTLLAARCVAPSNTLVRGYFRLLAGNGWTGPDTVVPRVAVT